MNQTDRELPAEIEAAIERVVDEANTNGWIEARESRAAIEEAEKNTEAAVTSLRHAIIAALEPDRALRERCERLRQIALIAKGFYDATLDQSPAFMDVEYLEPGDLTDDLQTDAAKSAMPS